MPGETIRVGTCSWTEKSLIESGAFYPEDVGSAEARLRYYASRFDTVEIDSSYHALPTGYMAKAWRDRTPANFLFHLKAFGALTGHGIDPTMLPPELFEMLPAADRLQQPLHVTEPAILREMARAMVDALKPLRDARKLGFIVFQFPPWFTCKSANRDYLLHCRESMGELPIAVEFRHGSWLSPRNTPETFAFLREHRITYIACDEPQYGTQVTAPFLPEATTAIGYLRLHGRNTEGWQDRSDPGYGYRYDEDELQSIARAAGRLARKTRTVFVMFNNCHAANAVTNALELAGILARRSDLPC